MRLDRSELAPAKSALIYEGWIARTHSDSFPLVYASGDEYRDADELNNILDQVLACAGTTEQRTSIALTLLHPSKLLRFGGMEDAKVVGSIIGGRLDDDHVIAQFVVWDPEAIAAIDGGIHELSLGYTAKLDEHRFQRECRLDHLAIVPAGRCGTCELNPSRSDACDNYHLDQGGTISRVAIPVPDATPQEVMKIGDLNMGMKITLDAASEAALTRVENAFERLQKLSAASAPVEGNSEHNDHGTACACKNGAGALNTGQSTMDELQKQLEAANAALAESQAKVASLETELASTKSDAAQAKVDADLAVEKASAKLDAAQAKVDALTAELADAVAKADAAAKTRSDADEAAYEARVDARVELLNDAVEASIDGAKSLKDVEIKLAVIKKVRNKDIKADADPGYIQGLYEIAMEQLRESKASVAGAREAIKNHEDGAAAAVSNSATGINEEAEKAASAKRREEAFAGKKTK